MSNDRTMISIPGAALGAALDDCGTKLLGLVPPISRARGWRLYTRVHTKVCTKTGGRIIDLWQYGGRALLGHNPPGLLRAFKNKAERGLFAPLPHAAGAHLCRALESLFPGRIIRLYTDRAALHSAVNGAVFADPAFAGPAEPPVDGIKKCLWRPYLGKETQDMIQSSLAVVPVLPLPFPCAPAALALHPSIEKKFPPSQIISPLLLEAAARCVYDLAAFPERGSPRIPKTEEALKTGPWRRRGIYFWPTVFSKPAADPDNAAAADTAAYESLFQRFLEAGFLLPPHPLEPAILPGELSPGEDAKLAALLNSGL